MRLPSIGHLPFWRSAPRTGHPLGTLELKVLEQLWRADELTVRDVFEQHPEPLAYTTLMTTLDRLYKKGYLRRRKAGRAFVYRAALTRDEYTGLLAKRAVDAMLVCARPAAAEVLSHFVDAVEQSDAELLDELERVVKARRRGEKS